jgi:hypothetical protein
MRDQAQLVQQPLDPVITEQQWITAGQDHIPDSRLAPDIRQDPLKTGTFRPYSAMTDNA